MNISDESIASIFKGVGDNLVNFWNTTRPNIHEDSQFYRSSICTCSRLEGNRPSGVFSSNYS